MSKNVKTYLLLGVVLIIWGFIGFKVFKTISKKPEIPVVQPSTRVRQKTLKKKDTFTLMANYRDPFLGTLPGTKKKAVKQTVNKKPKVRQAIVYSGLVSQSKSGKTRYFVTIDGKQHIMSINEEINGVTLLNGNSQSIKVRDNDILETIPLAQ